MADTTQPEVSEKGIYFDSKAGRVVVDGPPEEGVQIVPPGGEVDVEAKADIARFNGDAPAVTAVGAPAEDQAEPEAAEPKKAPAAKKAK